MQRFEHAAAFILAGGASTRMGRDKALLEIGGQPMLLHVAKIVEPLVGSPEVIGAPERYSHLGLRVSADDFPGCGPLGGIATALGHSQREWILVLGCDLPHLTPAWLEYLIKRAGASRAGALIPMSDTGYEPLCAMYSKRAEAAMVRALGAGVRKVMLGLAEVEVTTIAPGESNKFDSDGRLFKNINSPADYEEARGKFSMTGKR
ncbi:MAG: molybdenum cofactor guanylyltransferase [Candidatus Acidiferrales bacterium]